MKDICEPRPEIELVIGVAVTPPTELRLDQIGRIKLGRWSTFDEEVTFVLNDPMKIEAFLHCGV